MTINGREKKKSIGMLFGLSDLFQVSLLAILILMCHRRLFEREFIIFLSLICTNPKNFSLTLCPNYIARHWI